MRTYLLKLNEKDRECLGAIRLMPTLQAALEGAYIWLRGNLSDGGLPLAIQHLPALERYWLKHQKYPEQLNELLPNWIDELPSLSYRQTPNKSGRFHHPESH